MNNSAPDSLSEILPLRRARYIFEAGTQRQAHAHDKQRQREIIKQILLAAHGLLPP